MAPGPVELDVAGIASSYGLALGFLRRVPKALSSPRARCTGATPSEGFLFHQFWIESDEFASRGTS
jgi:hypothetical protein